MHFKNGNKLYAQGKYEEAIEEYYKAIEENKESSYIYYYNIGVCYTKLKNADLAISNYISALCLKEKHIESLHNLALEYYRLKEFKKAYVICKRACSLTIQIKI